PFPRWLTPRSPLFPYTTLFRSGLFGRPVARRVRVRAGDPADRALALEFELRFELGEILEFRQWRQLVQALEAEVVEEGLGGAQQDRKSTRLNSSHVKISYAVFC